MNLSDAVGKLEAMGSPDQIALEFEILGIKSLRCSPWTCAVADYITEMLGGEYVSVGTSDASWSADGDLDNRETTKVPENVSQFILRFDQGAYPQLELVNA